MIRSATTALSTGLFSVSLLLSAGDLAAQTTAESAGETAAETSAAETKPDEPAEKPTAIECDHLKMTTLEHETQFVFSSNVVVTTTDMTVYCDRLEVYAARGEATEESNSPEETAEKKHKDADAPADRAANSTIEEGSTAPDGKPAEPGPTGSAEIAENSSSKDPATDPAAKEEPESDSPESRLRDLERLKRIIATGNVRILQADRIAMAGRAEIYPQEGRVVLTESPVLQNPDGRVSGARITFYQDEREAVVESGDSQRPRVELPPIPAFGGSDDFK